MKSLAEKFRFRHFALSHHKAAMKVGTDAILLGAGVELGVNHKWILDIGTGCGIVALMIAQRSTAHIDAIDIDKDSTHEAQKNFESSPWPHRLKSIHTSLANFVSGSDQKKYDLIVSNPPFFQNSLLPENDHLKIARHNVSLTLQGFAGGASYLLSENGRLAAILPSDVAPAFCSVVEGYGLFLNTQTIIIPKPNKAPKRLILEFSRMQARQVQTHQLTIRAANGNFTDEYKKLTHMFHPDGYLEEK